MLLPILCSYLLAAAFGVGITALFVPSGEIVFASEPGALPYSPSALVKIKLVLLGSNNKLGQPPSE